MAGWVSSVLVSLGNARHVEAGLVVRVGYGRVWLGLAGVVCHGREG